MVVQGLGQASRGRDDIQGQAETIGGPLRCPLQVGGAPSCQPHLTARSRSFFVSITSGAC